jgi:hypothetical protein
MTKLSIIVLTAMLAAGGVAAPAFAATATAPSAVPFCNVGSDASIIDRQKQILADEMQLSTKPGSSIEVWNGCLKVMSTENGDTTIAFYDPDSLKLVATI